MGSPFKNVNLYWGTATGLAVWFLLWHTPHFWKTRRILQIRDWPLAIHIVAAATIYLACAHNCLITPSLGSLARLSHTWIGRLGLVSGIVGFSLGAFLAWSRLAVDSQPLVEGSTTLGFSIPITIGGIMQIISEINGYRAIRRHKKLKDELAQQDKSQLGRVDRQILQQKQQEALREHIRWMLSLFVLACGIPAAIRLAFWMSGGDEDSSLAVVLIVLLIAVLQVVGNRYIQTMSPPPPNEQEIGPIHPHYDSISN